MLILARWIDSFNRTFMELKSEIPHIVVYEEIGFNRTFMELKYGTGNFFHKEWLF